MCFNANEIKIPTKCVNSDFHPLEDESQRIVRVLKETNGVIAGPKGAALRLGLKRTTLLSRMKRLGIDKNRLV